MQYKWIYLQNLCIDMYVLNCIKSKCYINDLIIYQNHSNVVFSDHVEHVHFVHYLEYVYCTKNRTVTKHI